MKRKGIVIGVLMLLIATTVFPVHGVINNANNDEILITQQTCKPSVSQTVEIAIDPSELSTNPLDDTFDIYEGQLFRLTITGYWNPPNATKQICLWANNTTIPPGATLTPECNCDDGQVTSIFEWIPAIGQAGTYYIFFSLGKTCYYPLQTFILTIIVHPTGSDNPPIVIIDSPVDGITVDIQQVKVTGYASDDIELRSFGRHHEWIDGEEESSSTFPTPRPNYYTFEENFSLYEGWNIITIYVSDSNLQDAQDQIVIYYEIPSNQPPNKPTTPQGSSQGRIGQSYTYSSVTSDPNGDNIYYLFSWGDGNDSGWIGPYASGQTVSESHVWNVQGSFSVKVKAKDDPNGDGDPSDGSESFWSNPLPITMPKTKQSSHPMLNFLVDWLIERFPLIKTILGFPTF